MKKNMRVVQINGFRGIFLALFVVSCLIAGFVAFPAFVAMNGWNYLFGRTGSFPLINFGEGVLLWAIVAFGVFIFNKKKFIVSFNSQQELTDDEVQDVISKIKSQTPHSQILRPKDSSKDFSIENKENLQEASSETKETKFN